MLKRIVILFAICFLSFEVHAVAQAEGVLAFPEGLTIIDDYAFYDATDVKEVILPEGLLRLGVQCFAYSGLTQVTLPDTLEFIADDAFEGCSALTVSATEGTYAYEWAVDNGYVQEDMPEPSPIDDFGYKIADGEVTITKYIGYDAQVVIPGVIEGFPVTCIGNQAFFNCNKITSITLPAGVTRIKGTAFAKCSSLTSITIPDSVTSIGGSAFWGCSSLTSVVIPDGVTSIGVSTFQECSSLTDIIIPDSVTSIGFQAFYESGLTHIIIPDSVTSIEQWAFHNCVNLTSVTIPDSVTSIGDSAFSCYGSPYITILTPARSCAHLFAIKERIPFSLLDPVVPDNILPDDFYRNLRTFSIDGVTYYEAELLKAYNGVAPSDAYAIRTFYMDAQQHVVTDASVLCKLYTLSMYVNGEASINSLLSTWKTTSQTCSSTATKFLTDKQLFNSLGAAAGDVVNALTIKSVTWLAGIKDLVNTLTDAGQAEAILLMVDIKNYSSHLSEMTDYTSNIPVCINGGAYDYDLVNIKLQYYAYCRTCYKLVQGMCMPVIDKITQNYASSWDLAFDHLTTFCFSFAETFVPSINEGLAWTGPAIKGIGMVVQNDFSATNILNELFSVASVAVQDYVWKDVDSIATITDLTSGLLNIVTGSVSSLCNFHGMDPNEYDAFKAPYYITIEEMQQTTLYKNHQLLAQPLS